MPFNPVLVHANQGRIMGLGYFPPDAAFIEAELEFRTDIFGGTGIIESYFEITGFRNLYIPGDPVTGACPISIIGTVGPAV
jgi:hypothetical protein